MKKGKLIVTMAVVSALGFSGQALAKDDTPSIEVEVTKTVDVDKTIDSNNSETENVTVNKTVDVQKPEAEAEDGSAAAVNGSEITDNSKKLEIDEIEIDKSEKDIDIQKTVDIDKEKTINKAEEGSVAALNGDAKKSEVEAEYGSAAALDGDASTQEAEEGAIAAIGGNASKEETEASIDEVEGGSVAATTGGTASMLNSNNNDESVKAEAEEGGIAINSSKGSGEVEVNTDSNDSTATDHSAVATKGGSVEIKENVGNTTNSYNDTTKMTIGNVDVEIASSELDGEVSGNVASPAPVEVPATGDNSIDGGVTTNGITVLSQNTGFSSLVQQSVNVQVNR